MSHFGFAQRKKGKGWPNCCQFSSVRTVRVRLTLNRRPKVIHQKRCDFFFRLMDECKNVIKSRPQQDQRDETFDKFDLFRLRLEIDPGARGVRGGCGEWALRGWRLELFFLLRDADPDLQEVLIEGAAGSARLSRFPEDRIRMIDSIGF